MAGNLQRYGICGHALVRPCPACHGNAYDVESLLLSLLFNLFVSFFI
jgi:hypothetical protein